MKDNLKYKKIVDNYVPQLPNKFFAGLLYLFCFFKSKKGHVHYEYTFDKKKYKNKQVILLGDHSARDTVYYTLYGYKATVPNIVIGYQNVFEQSVLKILLKVGIIPKKLYVADIKATKNILRIINDGGSIALFPEGIQSICGTTMPLNPSTISLLKKAKLPVILAKSYGTYLVNPRYSKIRRSGYQKIVYSELFTADDINNLSNEELNDKLLKAFKYDDFNFNKENHYKYSCKEPIHKGIENLLYLCPCCNKEFTIESNNDYFYCNNCNTKYYIDNEYNLTSSNNMNITFKEWINLEREKVREEIFKDNFEVEYNCIYQDINYGKLTTERLVRGEGKIIINKDGLKYIGTKDNENVELSFDIKNVPSYFGTLGRDNILYYGDDFYRFAAKDNLDHILKYTFIVEELHKAVDPKWNQAWKDLEK